MYCPSCQTDRPAGAAFCFSCGHALAESAPIAPAPASDASAEDSSGTPLRPALFKRRIPLFFLSCCAGLFLAACLLLALEPWSHHQRVMVGAAAVPHSPDLQVTGDHLVAGEPLYLRYSSSRLFRTDQLQLLLMKQKQPGVFTGLRSRSVLVSPDTNVLRSPFSADAPGHYRLVVSASGEPLASTDFVVHPK